MRSAAVVLFIGLVAAVALYCAQRPTVAKGEVIGAQLVEMNPMLKSMDCQDQIPIGLDGATFECKARFHNGDEVDYKLQMNRAGQIEMLDQGETRSAPRIKKTSDPWGD